MRVLQLGSSVSAAQAAVLLMRTGATVTAAVSEPDGIARSREEIALDEALAYGKLAGPALAEVDAARLEELLQAYDIVIDDHPLSYWLARGIDLKQRYGATGHPGAHWCAITPYGLEGVGADWAASELTMQASGPMMIRIGEPGRPPLPMAGPQASIAAGWHAALVASSLYYATTEVPGTLIDLSMQESMFMHGELGVSNWHYNRIEQSHRLNADPASSHSTFQTLDGDVFMMFHDREWPRVARMVGRPDLEREERFMARYQRQNHMEELDAILTPWFLTRSRVEAVEAGQAAGVPIAYSQTPIETLSDPQLASREAFMTIEVQATSVQVPLGIDPDLASSASASPGEASAGRDGYPDPQNWTFRTSGATPDQPLHGVRVIDLTNTWAAPRAATLLADLGAEVIKVEGLDWMDMLRGFTSPPPNNPSYPRGVPGEDPWNRYIMWLGLARNKRSLGVELTRPEGRAILDELVAVADVVVTNMSASTRAKHRLSYDVLASVNPDIIFATLSGYGDDGPRCEWRLFGDGQASLAGIFSTTGYEGESSFGLGAYGDPINGTALAYQIVAALHRRNSTGTGMHVDVSAVETCLSYGASAILAAQLFEVEPAPVGFDPGARWPHAVFACLGQDSWIAVSCASDDERAGLAQALAQLGHPIDASLVDSADAWHTTLAEVFARHEPGILQAVLRDHGVAVQHVIRGRDVESEAALTSRGFIAWPWRADLGSYPLYAPPWRINGARTPVNPSPRMGEHNDFVLQGVLGMTAEEIARLSEARVVGDRPTIGAELGFRPSATDAAG